MNRRHQHADERTISAATGWKTWLLTSFAIYPVITTLALGTSPVLGRLPLPARLALLIPTTVAITQWLLMPYLRRRLAHWLTRP